LLNVGYTKRNFLINWYKMSKKSSGTNSLGNHYATPSNSSSGSNSYRYDNANGTYYYKNSNGSTYYSGTGTYTPAPRK
jgi:hypothetical protein